MAVRSALDTPPAAVSSDQRVTTESLGWQLRDTILSLPLYSVSLHDHGADLLWLSEGEVGLDEQALVVEALQVLADDRALPGCEYLLEDGRLAVFLAVRTHRGALVGLAMILADPGESQEGVLDQLITPQLRTILRKLAVVMRPAPPHMSELEGPVAAQALSPARQSAPQWSPPDEAGWPVSESPEPVIEDVADLPPTPLAADAQWPVPSSPPTWAHSAPAQRPAPARPEAGSLASASATRPRPSSRSAAADPPESLPRPASGASGGGSFPASPMRRTELPRHATGFSPRSPRQAASDLALDAGYASAAPTLSAAPSSSPATRTGPRPASHLSRAPSTSQLSQGASAHAGGRALVPRGFADPPEEQSGLLRSIPEPPGLRLEVLPFLKLRQAVRTRRYEVLPRPSQREASRPAAALDTSALQQLAGWLGAHRSAWSLEPTSFTLNLSIDTLEDEQFLRDAAAHLKANSIGPDSVGFEIAEALCTQHRAQVERFITSCEQLGCFVAIDDFSFDSAILPLLRSRAVRLIRIDPRLIAAAQRDKLSEALIVATIHAAKVLGIHSAAKGVQSQPSLQWLKSAGCDFAQGPALVQPQRLELLV